MNKKKNKKSKKKNTLKQLKRKLKGFTLVELLAVIVILALIMIIAIPSVLTTLTVAKKNSFIEYYTKVYVATEKQYLNDELVGKSHNQCVIYDITEDIGLSSTGEFKGYTLVKKEDGVQKYYITLHDDEYMIYGVEYSGDLSAEELLSFSDENDTNLTKGNLAAVGNCELFTNASDGSSESANESGSSSSTETNNGSSTSKEEYKFAVGSYIKYYPTQTYYMPDTTKTGASTNNAMNQQPINPSELTVWRILSINSDGTMDIISENVSTNLLYIYGKNGYINYIGVINEATRAYVDNTYALSSRGIGYVNQTEYITDLSKIESQTAPWKYNNFNTIESQGGGDSYGSDVSSKDRKLIKDTIGFNATTISGEARGYWIASRHYYCWESGAFWFHPRYIDKDGVLSPLGIWGNSGYGLSIGGNNQSFSIRPIITLKAGIKEASGKGTKAEPFELKF